MSEDQPAPHGPGAGRRESAGAASLGAAEWLSLMAAPVFGVMALLTATQGGGPAAILCSAAPDGFPLSGMTPMYVLMSVFHLAPWLNLLSGAVRKRADGSDRLRR